MSFSLRAPDATGVRLCLFARPESAVAEREVSLRYHGDGVFRGRVEGLGPGTLYGYRVEGPYAPRRGLRFNPGKLLVDPYARAITGEPRYDASLFGSREGDDHPLSYNGADSAGDMPKCVVVDDAFDWQGVGRPRHAWQDTVIYECHVKGMTQLHGGVPSPHRGTYLGLTAPEVHAHWRALGVTAVQLLPVQQIGSEKHLLVAGRRNYWGYSTLGFLAPHAGYATSDGDRPPHGRQVREFKTMVRELHRAGFEVLLDVVYNHTPEGDHRGPTLSLRGIDNRGFYRLSSRTPEHYVDFTGCGNSLDIHRPACRRLVLDSLRYWAGEMGVDGFRFDLATFLGRHPEAFVATAPMFQNIAEDPLLSSLKWIAEPWDLGPDGYRLGQFPARWREWNDRYRIDVRRFWRGRGAQGNDLIRRLTGSRDVLGGKPGITSINYVVSHDGFTLADLVSYERKHNEDNGEDNRDGSNDDTSHNWGHEGPTDDPSIQQNRRRACRNLMATLAFSQGTPMISQGDELGRSQRGNNNPYCQDNATTWFDWSRLATPDGIALQRFVGRVLGLRRRLSQVSGLSWPRPGEVVCYLPSGVQAPPGEDGGPQLEGSSFGLCWLSPAGAEDVLLLIHGEPEAVDFRLPPGSWRPCLDTAYEDVAEVGGEGGAITGRKSLEAFSLCLLVSN